jgi:transposase
MTHPAATPQAREVTGGIDTHSDTHTAAALDSTGRLLGHHQFPATATGYTALLAWLRSFGHVVLIGIEGTGAYGAGITGHLHTTGIALVEVNRPDRGTRRHHGKSDPIDAEAAARAAQSGRATGVPKLGQGQVEALRVLRIARRSAVEQRAHTQTRIKALIVTAPESLRARLRQLGDRDLITYCATRRPDRTTAADPAVATVLALRALARRHQQFTAEIADLDTLIAPLGRRGQPCPARPERRRPGCCGSAPGHRWGEPAAAAVGGGVRDALRHRATAGLVRADPASPAQPWW